MPEATYDDLVRAGPIFVLGGARIEEELRVGQSVCGYSRMAGQPGLGYPYGWEGQLLNGGGTLLAASSFYLDGENKELARSWRFAREGAPRYVELEEGGNFTEHDAIRIYHGGANVVSKSGQEARLRGRDGTFAVIATSNLTNGPVPVWVGKHNGFFFSAVRIPE